MAELDKNLVLWLTEFAEREDDCVEYEYQEYWFALIVEKKALDDIFETVREQVGESGHCFHKDFIDFTEDPPEVLGREWLSRKVIIVESPEHYKIRAKLREIYKF